VLQFCTEFSLITLTGSIHDPKPETGPGRCREHAKARDRRERSLSEGTYGSFEGRDRIAPSYGARGGTAARPPAGPRRQGRFKEDYVFDGVGENGKPSPVRLSDLFRDGSGSLLIYSYMFPRHKVDKREPATSGEISKLPRDEQPCPSCTGLLDQLDAAARHFEGLGGSFAVVAKTPLKNLLAVARDRGWRYLRLLGEKYLQARFQFGRGKRPANTDDACFQTRYRRHDPPVLGIRPCLGRKRSRAASSRCGDHRAILEYVRSAARRAAGSHGAASI
jgi:Bacterial protein of unknown function (DUF899)